RCKDEIPLVKGVREKHKELVIVGIGIYDSEAAIRKHVLANAIPWGVGYDEGDKISGLYGITYGAGMVFINKDGVVAERFLTGVSEKKFNETLDKIL
ncbi:MAG: hypothetical protein WA162_09500, partial [Thermodesulfobacteriota bacterium]